MKKKDIPQDKSALNNVLREVVYAKDEDGKYTFGLSQGWYVKKDALDNAWEDVESKIEDAKKAVIKGDKSPIYYFKEKLLMDMPTLADYTGYWTFTIKRHFRVNVFNRLKESTLANYATIFGISIDELKSPDFTK